MLIHPTRMPRIDGNLQAVLLRWKTVLGNEQVAVRFWRHQEDAADKKLLFARLERARPEMGLTIAQDIERRTGDQPQSRFDIRSIAGQFPDFAQLLDRPVTQVR